MKTEVTKLFTTARTKILKHSPEILIGIGITGMVTTTVLAVKATPKALQLIEEKKKEDRTEKLTPIETIKVTWKPYIPAVTTGVFSIACLIGSSTVNARRNAALATAYKLSETAFSEYKNKVIETIGEKKEQVVREQIDKDRIERNPVSTKEVIITEKGNTLCYDSISGRYFKSDIERINKAVNELNRRMVYDVYISLNEFYYELGLEGTVLGDDLGWTLDNGLINLHYTSQIADDGTPCVVINYDVRPEYDYAKLS